MIQPVASSTCVSVSEVHDETSESHASTSTTQPSDNSNTQPSDDDREPCPTCNRYPHPIESVRKLPAELECCFPVPTTAPVPPKKRRRVTNLARVMTSEEIMAQYKEKEDKALEEEKKKSERQKKTHVKERK